jgi:nucleotidyltransferase substrate binding protein (TIGR01987 family)
MNDISGLDMSLLARAVGRLDESLADYAVNPNKDYLRDSVIVRFMFTYELSLKTLLRFMEETGTSSEIASLGFQTMIRRADDRGLLQKGWPEWKDYRDARNLVAHTYNEERAMSVARAAGDFAVEARFLHDAIVRRLSGE